VYYRTENGTATSMSPTGGPGDYTSVSGSITIPAGQTSAAIAIKINGDTGWEENESFFVRFDAALNATVGAGSSTITLLADDVQAVADSYVTTAPGGVGVWPPGVLVNDRGVSGAPLTAELVSGPANGAIFFGSDGSFSYLPNEGFVGNDSFQYRALSGGYSAVATATIVVRAATPPSLIVPPATTLAEDAAVAFSAATGNASQISDPAIGSNPLQLNLAVSNGTLTLSQLTGLTIVDGQNGTGRVTVRGTLAALNAALDGMTYRPVANFAGNASLSLAVTDFAGGSDLRSVSLSVTPVNDAPVNNIPTTAVTTGEDTPVTIPKPTVSDVDVGNGNVRVTFAVPASTGTILLGVNVDIPLTVTGNGTNSVTIEGLPSRFNSGLVSILFRPAAEFSGTVPLTMTTGDKGSTGAGGEQFDVDTITITVNPLNDTPAAQPDAYTTAEDSPLVGTPGVLVNDTDVDGPTLTAVLIAAPTHGTLVLNADGSFTYTPNADFNGTDFFTYRASDGFTGPSTGGPNTHNSVARVTITVTPVNDAPVTASDGYTIDEDAPLTVPAGGVLVNDSDADGDTLTAVLVSSPSHGTLAQNADGSFEYTPDADFNGTDSFTYKANDGQADGAETMVTITVNAVNDAPAAQGDSFTTDEDVPLIIAASGVLANDSDVDGDTLSAILVDGPAHGSLALNSDGSFSYAPDANFNGTDSFTYKVGDGPAESDEVTVTIAVNPVNDPPVAVDDGYSTNEDTLLVVSGPGVLGNDTDTDGNSLAAVLVSGPSHGSLALNADGNFTYTPAANFNGTDSFMYKTNDGSADGGIATVTITVNAVNDPPVANAGPDRAVAEGATITFDGRGSSDADGDALTYTWSFGDGTTATEATLTKAYSDNGTYTVTLTVSDGHGGTSTDTAVVTVTNVAPTAAIAGPASGVRGQVRTFTFSASDPSPVDQGAVFGYRIDWGDGTTSSVSGPGSGVAVNHTYVAAGTYPVKVWVTDKNGAEGAFAGRTYASNAVEVQGGNLVIGGTTGGDQIVLTAMSTPGASQVRINNVNLGTFTASGQIVVFAQAGNDTVSFATTRVQGTTYSVARPLLLFGGDGNDTLDARNATGPAVLLGGAGTDTIYGSSGRSILIGGLGGDTLRGSGADDILIGGITDYDNDLAVLASLRAEWARTDANYATRKSHLLGPTGGLNRTAFLNGHVLNDSGAVDNLYGNGGQDWFFDTSTDNVNDRQSNETITNV
jgi:large repetitive protein